MGLFVTVGVLFWDIGLVFLNLITYPFRPKPGAILRKGLPGYGGKWPEYSPPKKGDSRSSCPALNAMANHGILPRDGKNISFREMSTAIRNTYNFAPSFCYFVPKYMADLLTRDYNKGTIDLSDIDVHNGIEHDGSLFRHDTIFQPDQSKIALDLIDEFLSSATGPNNTVTARDMSAALTRRRLDSRSRNSQYTQAKQHKVFGSSNASSLLTAFGGRLDDIAVFLKEERLPDGWEPRMRDVFGRTILGFNVTVLKVNRGVDERKVKEESDRMRKARIAKREELEEE